MDELGMHSMELDDDDHTAIAADLGDLPAEPRVAAEMSHLDEPERLDGLCYRGIVSEKDFQANKYQIFGL